MGYFSSLSKQYSGHPTCNFLSKLAVENMNTVMFLYPGVLPHWSLEVHNYLD